MTEGTAGDRAVIAGPTDNRLIHTSRIHAEDRPQQRTLPKQRVMSQNARRLPTLAAEGGQCPRARAAPATKSEGRRASSRINGCRGSVRPAGAEGGGRRRRARTLAPAKVPEAKPEGLLCDPEPQGVTDPVPEARPVAMSKEPPGSSV
jgi:hypothetical protein